MMWRSPRNFLKLTYLMIDYGERHIRTNLLRYPAREYETESSRRMKNFLKDDYFACQRGHPYGKFDILYRQE